MSKVAHNLKGKARTGDVLITENIDFSSLLLSDHVLRGLKNSGFVRPSPIQLKAIPLGRCGLDLIVQAKSGTGKTCVFSVIALESIATDTASTQVLVLAPTREIAVQICEVIKSIGSAMKELACHTFIGGLPLHEDRVKLKKCHIAVGSPGRIKQLIEGGVLKTDSVRLFVLDEADELLQESFQEQINWIYSALPENKQMLALSATYPEYLAEHLTAYMRNPTYLRLNVSDPALLGIRQYYCSVPYHPMSHVVFDEKSKVLVNILSSVSFDQCLIFSNLQTRAQTLSDSLTSHGWPTACIAGCLDQRDRNQAMARLKTYKCRILISTDLTSRGIDADKVNMVINLDVPRDHETYLHRIGRAGRFGSFGIAITLISDGQERLDLDSIEKKCNTQIYLLPDPVPSDLAKPDSPVFLDDVVSSEVINTGDRGSLPVSTVKQNWVSPTNSHVLDCTEIQGSLRNSPVKQSRDSPSKSSYLDNGNHIDTKNMNGTSDKSSVYSEDSNRRNLPESQAGSDRINIIAYHGEDTKGEAKDTLNGMIEKETKAEKDITDTHEKNNGFTDFVKVHVDTRSEVSYEDVEYSEMNNLESSLRKTTIDEDKIDDCSACSENFEHTGSLEHKYQLENNLMSLYERPEYVETAKKENDQETEGKIVTDEITQAKQANMLPDEKVLKDDMESSFKKESQMEQKDIEEGRTLNYLRERSEFRILSNENMFKCDKEDSSKTELCDPHRVQIGGLPVHRSGKVSSLAVTKVNISEMFKKNIGYKSLDQTHSYSAAKKSLKAFRDKIDTDNDKELKDVRIVCSVPRIDCRDLETDTLRQAVSQLQDILENRMTINSTENSVQDAVSDENENLEKEESSSISSEDEFEAKSEILNRISQSVVPCLNAESGDKQLCDVNVPAEIEVKVVSNENIDVFEEKVLEERKQNVQKSRRQRYGYRGNFAIGHLLQQERAREQESGNSLGDNHYGGRGQASGEPVCGMERELDYSKNFDISGLQGLDGNTVAKDVSESNRAESATSLILNGELKSSAALSNLDFKVAGDLKMKNNDEQVTEGGKKDESDSESNTISSGSGSESSEPEGAQDKGARPKLYRVRRNKPDGDVLQDVRSKRGKNRSMSIGSEPDGDVLQDVRSKRGKNRSMSIGSVTSGGQSSQEQWRWWHEQYENWHRQCMTMWGYPGTSPTYFQSTGGETNVSNYGYPTGFYNSPSMYYPYQNYQQGYPWGYFSQHLPFSQQSNYSDVSEQVGSAHQFQQEYLKQMSKYWKKEKVKKQK